MAITTHQRLHINVMRAEKRLEKRESASWRSRRALVQHLPRGTQPTYADDYLDECDRVTAVCDDIETTGVWPLSPGQPDSDIHDHIERPPERFPEENGSR